MTMLLHIREPQRRPPRPHTPRLRSVGRRRMHRSPRGGGEAAPEPLSLHPAGGGATPDPSPPTPRAEMPLRIPSPPTASAGISLRIPSPPALRGEMPKAEGGLPPYPDRKLTPPPSDADRPLTSKRLNFFPAKAVLPQHLIGMSVERRRRTIRARRRGRHVDQRADVPLGAGERVLDGAQQTHRVQVRDRG